MPGDQILLRHGACSDPNRISTNGLENANTAGNTFNPTDENHEYHTTECKNCDFFQTEILNLRKQMAAMENEYILKLSQEKERFRKIFKEKQMLVVKQLNQLASEVSLELMVIFLLYSNLGERNLENKFVSNAINILG